MEINRLKTRVQDALVEQELIKLRNWIFKEAMTGRGGERIDHNSYSWLRRIVGGWRECGAEFPSR